MSTNQTFYGQDDDERLKDNVDDLLDEILDQAVERVGEPFSATADRISWPIRVHVFRKMDVGGDKAARAIACRAIETAFESLDEEYGDPDGDQAEPSEAVNAAALAFGRAVVADYAPWACEKTGEVLEFTREQMEKRDKEGGDQ